jgi:hypothetical protein
MVPVIGIAHIPNLFGDISELGHVRIDHGVAGHRRAKGIQHRDDTRSFRIHFGPPTAARVSDFLRCPARRRFNMVDSRPKCMGKAFPVSL